MVSPCESVAGNDCEDLSSNISTVFNHEYLHLHYYIQESSKKYRQTSNSNHLATSVIVLGVRETNGV